MANFQQQPPLNHTDGRYRSSSFGNGDDSSYFETHNSQKTMTDEDFYATNHQDGRLDGTSMSSDGSHFGQPINHAQQSYNPSHPSVTAPASSGSYQPMFYAQNSASLPSQPNIPPPPPRQPYTQSGGYPSALQAGIGSIHRNSNTAMASNPTVGGYSPGNTPGRTMPLMTSNPTPGQSGAYGQYVPQSPSVTTGVSPYNLAYGSQQYTMSVQQSRTQYNPAAYSAALPPPPPPPPLQRHGTTNSAYNQMQLPQPPPPPPLQNPSTFGSTHHTQYPNNAYPSTSATVSLPYTSVTANTYNPVYNAGSPVSNPLTYGFTAATSHEGTGSIYQSSDQSLRNSDVSQRIRNGALQNGVQPGMATSSYRPITESELSASHHQIYDQDSDGNLEYKNPLPTPPPPPSAYSHGYTDTGHYRSSSLNGQRWDEEDDSYSEDHDDSSPPLVPPHGTTATSTGSFPRQTMNSSSLYHESEERQKLEDSARESLYSDLETALSNGSRPHTHGYSVGGAAESRVQSDIDGLFPRQANLNILDEVGIMNSQTGTRYGALQAGNSSDEAAAAWKAMREDEYRENLDRHVNGYTKSSQNDAQMTERKAHDEEDDGLPMDLSSFSGLGFYGGFDDEPALPTFRTAGQDNVAPILAGHTKSTSELGRRDTTSTAVTSNTRTSGSTTLYGDYVYPNPEDDVLHPFPVFAAPAARVDTFGTGGLSNPANMTGSERRNSFVEGDEFEGFVSASRSKTTSLDEESDDEMYAHFIEPFHYPTPSYERNQSQLDSGTSEPYLNTGQETRLKSSLSLNYPHTSTNQSGPARSKTDASVPAKPAGARPPASRSAVSRAAVAQSQVFDENQLGAIDLPSIKTRKFDPEKLSSKEFRKCTEPWAISQILLWLKKISEGEEFLREKSIAEAIVALFTHKVPTMNVADAETLAARVLKTMWEGDVLVRDEEWVKWNTDAETTGVIFQISGSGCYAPRLHAMETDAVEIPGRCYAHHCARTLKKISLGSHPEDREKKNEDWATFWKLKAENVEGISKKEIERQNNLHEVVQTESEFLEHMRVLRIVYHDQLVAVQRQSAIIKPQKFDKFIRDIFGKAEAVRKANEDHLLPQLKFRQLEQGPWVVGFSDIFREWIRRAKPAYIEYAASFPNADTVVRHEADRNILFRQFLEQCRQDPRGSRLDWQHFLKNPITRLQRYSLLLSTILKHTERDGDEKQNLQAAIDEIKAVTLECDTRVDEMTKQVVLFELGRKLVMRPGMEVNLRLEEKGREVIYQGDLQRTGNRSVTWLETHAILFDHYLILAKTVQQKDLSGTAGKSKFEKYDVSRMPIPMDLLVLENTADDGPVVKNSVKLIGPATKQVQQNPGNNRANIPLGGTPVPGQLPHTPSTPSVTPQGAPNWLGGDNANSDKTMYPFRIKHLGNKAHKGGEDNTYTLYAPTVAARNDWVAKIILAKERHAASLYRQNAEPFRVRVMSDAAFGYETGTSTAGPKQVNIRDTPLDRSIKEVEKLGPKPPVLCKSQVNCATAFHVGMGYGKQMVAIGTDSGVYVSDYDNPRGWSKAINNVPNVTQIAVLEEFSLFLVLANKSLIAYHLDVVVPPAGNVPVSESAKRAPQKLSGQKEVGFFATGRMKERMLVFYKKRDGLHSTFKVLEPVFQKATERKSRFSRRGTTEFFREFDEFYIPTDCFGINLFHSSLAIQNQKGFEVMTLDKKQPWTVPELKTAQVAAIAQRLSNLKPLGMFRLSDIEFLLCYEECGVYVNKHGEVSRSVIMEFVGKAKMCAHYAPYVLLFDSDFVEIRNADNGRLRQVIAGRDARCLDDGQSGGSAGQRTIKLAMVHPESDSRQIVVELLLNDDQKE